MANYIIIGGSHLQADFIETVKKNGFTAHVVDYDATCIGAKTADVFHCLSIDDLEGVFKLAQKLDIAGIHTVATEQGNVTANYVAEKLGLPCNGYEVALNTTDKVRMKTVLYKHNLATPLSHAVKSEEELSKLIISYPVIVKASDRSAGRGVALATNSEELSNAYNVSLKESFNKVVLIEEYFDAPQYSIETITCAGVHQIVAITQMGFSGPPYFVETEHFLPARISSDLQQRLEKYCLKSLDAFNIKYGACHIEVRAKNECSISMIEIASRMGGWRHWMIKSALGVDYLQAILDSSLNKSVSIKFQQKHVYAIARSLFNLSDYKKYLQEKVSGTQFVIDWVKPGRPVKNATNLIEAHGFYVITKESN